MPTQPIELTDATDGPSALMLSEDGTELIPMDDYSRYVTVRGTAQAIQVEAYELQQKGVAFPEDVWEGVIEAIENIRRALAALEG